MTNTMSNTMTNKRVSANAFMPSAAGFQVPTRHLMIGGVLFGVGTALCIAGIAVSGSGMLSASQRWMAGMERAPSEIAKDAFAAAKKAATAGAQAWQEENAAQHARA